MKPTDMKIAEMTIGAIYDYVSAYALERYEKGWDVIYECYGADDLFELIEDVGFENMEDLLTNLAMRQNLWNEQRLACQDY